jgi:hypothetical protein
VTGQRGCLRPTVLQTQIWTCARFLMTSVMRSLAIEVKSPRAISDDW